MVFGQLHYTKRVVFMPFLVAEILNFQGSAHHVGVGSLSLILSAILRLFRLERLFYIISLQGVSEIKKYKKLTNE